MRFDLPTPDPETQPFWDATKEGRFLVRHCLECGAYHFYPRPFCPECGALKVTWFEASGRGQIYSYTINRRGQANVADYRGADEYVVAYVELEEGPRVMTNIVDCDPETVSIGQSVTAVFHDTGQGSALVRFRPV